MTAFLPPDMALWTQAALLVASFAGSFISAAFGLGGGVLMLAILATVMPPAALIPVHGAVQFGSNLGRVLLLWRHVNWPQLGGFMAGSVIGVACGGMIAVNLPPDAVRIAIGLFILWSVLSHPPDWLHRAAPLTGVISSFLTMFFGATGPFVAIFVKSLGLQRHGYVATHATLMTSQHLLKSVAFGAFGFAFAPWLALIAAMIATGVLGTALGRLALNRLTNAGFQKALNMILILSALHLLWTGLRGWF